MCSRKEEYYTWETLEDIRDRLTSIEEKLASMEEYIEEKLNDMPGYDNISNMEDRITDLIYKCIERLDDMSMSMSRDDALSNMEDRIIDLIFKLQSRIMDLDSRITALDIHLETHRPR